MAKERISVLRSTLICSSSSSRLCATWKRQRRGEPGSARRARRPAASRREIRCCRRRGRRNRCAPRPRAAPVPQASGREIGSGAAAAGAGGADLEIDAGIGLEEALVGGRAVEEGLALRADLGRGDQRGQHIIERGVEIAGDGVGQHPVERIAADAEQQAIQTAETTIMRRSASRSTAPGEAALRAARSFGEGESGRHLHRSAAALTPPALPANSRGRGWW
jgi:hypothetical protein